LVKVATGGAVVVGGVVGADDLDDDEHAPDVIVPATSRTTQVGQARRMITGGVCSLPAACVMHPRRGVRSWVLMSGRASGTRALAVVVFAACALAGCSGSKAPVAKSHVSVWGDSLALQAAGALRAEGRAHGLDVVVQAFYGFAPCDIEQYARRDIAKQPDALVLAFTGNNLSPCMQRNGKRITGASYYATYRRDIDALVAAAVAVEVPVLVVGPPAFPASENVPDRVELDTVLRAVVKAHRGARYVASAPVVSPGGYRRELPCLPGETAALGCTGAHITVRSGNGIHFDEPRAVPCPNSRESGGCRYSAGGHRYAKAILSGLAAIPGLSYVDAAATIGVPIEPNRNE
jgi:hypothetical protein